MSHKISTLLITGAAGLVLAACGGTSESTVSKVADAPVDTMTTAELQKTAETAEKAGSEMNAPFNAFLSKYVAETNGIHLVAYDKVSAEDKTALENYITTLSGTDISGYTDNQKKAYWFNLYNAETVDLILNNYPLKSIKDIDKPWKEKRLTVNGKQMSLNNIEHDTVRKMYDEPRVHFAFNCASVGCPNLKMTAWEAETLDADLTQAAMDYIASPRGMTIEDDGDIKASEIFKWYKEDFGSNEKEVLTYLSKFAVGPKKTAMQNAEKVNDWQYDWSLNEAKSK